MKRLSLVLFLFVLTAFRPVFAGEQHHEPLLKSRKVFALKVTAGVETSFQSIGTTQMEEANYTHFGFYAIITDGKYIHYTDNDRNPRKRATAEIK
jgi:hypothetical protein